MCKLSIKSGGYITIITFYESINYDLSMLNESITPKSILFKKPVFHGKFYIHRLFK
jgi:hypothetical protein